MTTIHVARAHRGDEESRAWLVARFSPFLLLQARYRLQGALERRHPPEELVDEVWLTTLPRLGDLRPRDGHRTPVLLKFLSSTLLHKVNNLLTRYARERVAEGTGETERPAERIPAPWTSVVSLAARDEVAEIVRRTLDELGPSEREILVLRGIEQLSNQEVARRLELQPSAATMRYRRALAKLAKHLPRSVLDELPGE